MLTSTLFSVAGRTALVTGGSRGIGRMIAEGLVRNGARVYITARTSDACDRAAVDMARHGHCVSLPADISTVGGISALVAGYRRFESSLDILVNNAGTTWAAPFDEFPESGWDKVMDLNVKSPFLLTQALHAELTTDVDSSLAKVINISSIDGISLSARETYSYHASKAALIQLTRRMAVRLIEDGVVVSAVIPGIFPSDMNRTARDHAESVAPTIPAGRVGEPGDAAAAVLYLASRAGDYLVGSTLTVDGGLSHAR